MRSTAKRLTAAALAALMAAAVSGCGDKSAETGVKNGVHTVEVLFNGGSSKNYWEQKVEDFNNTIGKEKKIKIALDTKVDSNYDQAIEVAMQSDQLPDMFSYGPLKQLSERNMIITLDELDGTAKKLESTKEFMLEGMHKIGNKIYSYPSGMTLRGLVYNKDMFKKAGIVDENGEAKPPETYDEMVEYAKKLTDKGKMQYGIIFPVKWVSWVTSDILDASAPSAGSDGYDPKTGKYDYTVAQPLLDAVLKIKNDGSCYPGAEGMDNDPARAKFSEGQIGMKFAYSFDVGVLNDQFKAKCDWGVAPLPVKDKNNRYKQYAAVSASMRVSRRALNRHGKDIMSEVFNWFNSDEITIEQYEQGFSIPTDFSLVKDIEIKNGKKNWKEFCALADISTVAPLQMPTNMDGLEKINETVVNDIWTGKQGIEALKRCSDAKNKGAEEYKKLNPDQDYSIYIDENWNTKR